MKEMSQESESLDQMLEFGHYQIVSRDVTTRIASFGPLVLDRWYRKPNVNGRGMCVPASWVVTEALL